MPQPENICFFTGKLKSFRAMLVGDFKDLKWGYGTMFLPDPDGKPGGQEIRIQAWEDDVDLLESLEEGTWIKISSTFKPSTFRGQEQSNFVIGKVTIIENVNQE